MRTPDVMDYIRSRYPEEVTVNEIADELSDCGTYTARYRESIYARKIVGNLFRYGYVTKRMEKNTAYYLWIPNFEEVSA